jgi:hypothetical protein
MNWQNSFTSTGHSLLILQSDDIMDVLFCRDHHGRDCMVVGFTTTCAISAYHHQSCEFEPCSWGGVLDTALCDKVCQWLAPGR